MIVRDLKKAIYYHLIAGICLAAALSILLIANNYRYSLVTATADLESIRVNILKVEHVIRVMKEKQSVAAGILPSDYHSRSHREILLLALERAKNSIKGSDISVGNFIEMDNELLLPVVLEFNTRDYYYGVNAMGYLQDLRFPSFRAENIVIRGNEETRQIFWRAEGSLRMPVERVITTTHGRIVR